MPVNKTIELKNLNFKYYKTRDFKLSCDVKLKEIESLEPPQQLIEMSEIYSYMVIYWLP